MLAAELISSHTYAANCTLRFPRLELIREDKDSTCCTTLKDVDHFIDQCGGKLNTNYHLPSDGLESLGTGQKRARTSRKPQLGAVFRQQDLQYERIDSLSLTNKVMIGIIVNLNALLHAFYRLLLWNLT